MSSTPKLAWDDLPPHLHRRIEDEVGGPVVEALVQEAGFSPGAPLRLRLGTGERAFVKAATVDINADTVAMYRREAQIGKVLPPLPEVPALRTWFEDPPWVVLIFEDVDGVRPAAPWVREELQQVIDALGHLSDRITPTPVPGLGSVVDKLRDHYEGWTKLADDPRRLALVDHDGWLGDHLDGLRRVAADWEVVAAGDSLLHADLRSDQLLLAGQRVFVVDWAHACVGDAVVDPFLFFPSVVLEGGPPLEELISMSPRTCVAPDGDLVALASAAASYFIERSTLPPPPGLPTVRDFQRRQGTVLLDWLRTRL